MNGKRTGCCSAASIGNSCLIVPFDKLSGRVNTIIFYKISYENVHSITVNWTITSGYFYIIMHWYIGSGICSTTNISDFYVEKIGFNIKRNGFKKSQSLSYYLSLYYRC